MKQKEFSYITSSDDNSDKEIEVTTPPSDGNFTEELEVFLEGGKELLSQLHCYPKLRKLSIINEFLEDPIKIRECKYLESLWLCDAGISVCPQLRNCSALTRLYLYNNEIENISPLKKMGQLKILWLCNNNIDSFNSFVGLTELIELNLAGNRISKLRGVERLPNLTSLNLSGNRITKLSELGTLGALSKLKTLSLTDPLFGENSVCKLSNYRSFVICSIPHIDNLDGNQINENNRKEAESLFLKKRLFYLMKMKTLRRTGEWIKQWGRKKRDKYLKQLYGRIQQMEWKHRKNEQLKLQNFPRDGHLVVEETDHLNIHNNDITDAVQQLYHHKHDVYNSWRSFCDSIRKEIQSSIDRLISEIESGSNIRIEEGSPNDSYVHSCANLIHSRLFELQSSQINVNRVSRILNPSLSLECDEAIQESGELVGDSEYNDKVQYLFYSRKLDNNTSVEFNDIIKDGFTSSTFLTNSLPLCINRHIHNNTVMIVKVFIKNFKKDKSNPKFLDPCESISIVPDSQSIANIYRIKEDDKSQKIWYIPDPRVISPEYIIQIRNIYAQDEEDDSADEIVNFIPDSTVNNMISEMKAENLDNWEAMVPFLGAVHNLTHMLHPSFNMEKITRVLQRPFEQEEKPLKRVIFGSRFPTIVEWNCVSFLDLSGQGIFDAKGLPIMPSLHTLIFDFNYLKSLPYEFYDQPSLRYLSVKYNLLRSITLPENGKTMSGLYTISLNGNPLSQPCEEIAETLFKLSPKLESLNLCGTFYTDQQQYRETIIGILPKINEIDGVIVNFHEKNRAERTKNNNDFIINQSNISKNASARRYLVPWSLRQTRPPQQPMNVSQDNWEKSVRYLWLEGKGLRRVYGLKRFQELKMINLRNNELTGFGGLDELLSLEQINVEYNYISVIDENLRGLKNLRGLEVGFNQISRLSNISHLKHLTILSVENNQLHSLRGIEELESLTQLFAANNEISDINEVKRMRKLIKLITLDLAGNQLVRSPEYRAFTIFQMRHIKVLDSEIVTEEEWHKAKDEFSGKLTTEMIREQAEKSKRLDEITELNLSYLGIRSILNLSRCKSITSLCLVHNQIESVSGLGSLTQLKTLQLSHNRIGYTLEQQWNNRSTSVEGIPSLGSELSTCTSLKVLELDSNGIRSMIKLDLGKLPSLKSLNLSNNEISRLEGLHHHPVLRYINLNHNRIRTIDYHSLVILRSLTNFSIENNFIRSLEGFQNLKSLKLLNLKNNRVANLFDLEKLLGLSELIDITLQYNPVQRSKEYRLKVLSICPSLVSIDNESVTREERDKAKYLKSPAAPIPGTDNVRNTRFANKVPMKISSVMLDCDLYKTTDSPSSDDNSNHKSRDKDASFSHAASSGKNMYKRAAIPWEELPRSRRRFNSRRKESVHSSEFNNNKSRQKDEDTILGTKLQIYRKRSN